MTYTSLISDVQLYAERSDQPFVDQIPRFVMLAENRIATEVRGLGYVRFVTSNLIQGNGELVKPTRWRETAAFSIVIPSTNKIKFLKQRSYTYLRSYWPDSAIEGEPKYYSDYAYEHYLIVPTPQLAYPIELSYFERPTPLSVSDQTNWTTQYAPQLLLYATLMEAQPFLKRPERTAEFQSLFDRAAATVSQESERRMMGDQALMRTGLQ
jgi:hypothetical protein